MRNFPLDNNNQNFSTTMKNIQDDILRRFFNITDRDLIPYLSSDLSNSYPFKIKDYEYINHSLEYRVIRESIYFGMEKNDSKNVSTSTVLLLTNMLMYIGNIIFDDNIKMPMSDRIDELKVLSDSIFLSKLAHRNTIQSDEILQMGKFYLENRKKMNNSLLIQLLGIQVEKNEEKF